MTKLAQTLSGDWTVTIPNPEESGWETELARFETGTATAADSPARTRLERAAVLTAIAMAFDGPVTVQSHDPTAVAIMRAKVLASGGTLPDSQVSDYPDRPRPRARFAIT